MNPAHERASRIDQGLTGCFQGPALFVAESMSGDHHVRGRNGRSAVTLLQRRKTARLDSFQHFAVMNQLTVNRRALRIVHHHDGGERVLYSETHSHCLSSDDFHSNRPSCLQMTLYRKAEYQTRLCIVKYLLVQPPVSEFYFWGPGFRRFLAGGRGAALRVTNLWAMPSKSRNTSRLTRDRRTSTPLKGT